MEARIFASSVYVTCFRPIQAYRNLDQEVVFSDREAYSETLTLPCGACLGCRASHAQRWAVRLMHESITHKRSGFITLTYSPQQLPKDLSLDLAHFQDFAKRVRKRLGPFRYFHCGEYGGENLRPHYHSIIFGHDFLDDAVLLRDNGSRLYYSPQLEALWQKGFCTVGAVTMESAAYVARYCLKKTRGSVDMSRYERLEPRTGESWHVKPEYATMSRRPGLGAKWFERFHADVYPEDEVFHEGRRYRPPRYYDQLFERTDPEAFAGVKRARRKRARDAAEVFSDCNLARAEEAARARLDFFKQRNEV